MSERLRKRRTSGFTILELMVTMAIASALLAIGAGMFLRLGRRTAMTQAVADVGLLFTKARNASSRVPAEIVADPKESQVFAKVEEVLQELRFEARPTETGTRVPLGIDGRECTIVGGEVVPDGGRVGGGVRVKGGGSISCGNYAAYDVDQGVSAEAWIKPAAGAACDIVSKGKTFAVKLHGSSAASRLQVTVCVVDPEKSAQESIEVTANIPLVRPGEWLGVAASYDGREILVSTDDGYGPVVRARRAETRPLALDPEAVLLFGANFDGWIDDCVFGGIRAADPVRLPEGVTVAEPKRIRFVNGRLDPAAHASGSERLTLRTGNSLTTFEIGPAGTVLAVRETPAEPSEATEEPPSDGKTPAPGGGGGTRK